MEKTWSELPAEVLAEAIINTDKETREEIAENVRLIL